MPKQLLIYENAKPITKTNHKDLYVKTGKNFKFAKDINSVPITAVEFPHAAMSYPVVFAGKDDELISVVIMGVRENENLFVSENGEINAKYIPAFLRRYPFVFSSTDKGANFTLCIDESFEGCNKAGMGERLFDSAGEQTLYLKNVLEFLKEYQAHFARTKAFCKKLMELKILEPMTAQFKPENGAPLSLSGFMAVNREKLKNLTGEQLQEMLKSDELELLYIHLQSMRNFASMLPQSNEKTNTEGTAQDMKEEKVVS